jgi:hypothetical protein
MTALTTACFALLGGLTWLLACLLLASARDQGAADRRALTERYVRSLEDPA